MRWRGRKGSKNIEDRRGETDSLEGIIQDYEKKHRDIPRPSGALKSKDLSRHRDLPTDLVNSYKRNSKAEREGVYRRARTLKESAKPQRLRKK